MIGVVLAVFECRSTSVVLVVGRAALSQLVIMQQMNHFQRVVRVGGYNLAEFVLTAHSELVKEWHWWLVFDHVRVLALKAQSRSDRLIFCRGGVEGVFVVAVRRTVMDRSGKAQGVGHDGVIGQETGEGHGRVAGR